MNEGDIHWVSWAIGVFTGAGFSWMIRKIWTEFWTEYEQRVERRARELASTKFAEFAGIKQ